MNIPPLSQQWTLSPGDQIARKQLHDVYGGGRQGGISPSKKNPSVFIFSDIKSGEKHGYLADKWNDDGSFSYTGEGQKGNQVFIKGNRAILEHVAQGRTLRVFDGVRGTVTYKGEFAVDLQDPYRWDHAPETNHGPLREVIVFRLIPQSLTVLPKALLPAEVDVVSVEAVNTETFTQLPTSQATEATRGESALVQRFISYLRLQGIKKIERLRIKPQGERFPLFCDLYCADEGLLIEAKASAARGDIRMAIGQLLDYRRFVSVQRLAILVPSKPSPDLMALATGLNIEVFWEDEGLGFLRSASSD